MVYDFVNYLFCFYLDSNISAEEVCGRVIADRTMLTKKIALLESKIKIRDDFLLSVGVRSSWELTLRCYKTSNILQKINVFTKIIHIIYEEINYCVLFL